MNNLLVRILFCKLFYFDFELGSGTGTGTGSWCEFMFHYTTKLKIMSALIQKASENNKFSNVRVQRKRRTNMKIWKCVHTHLNCVDMTLCEYVVYGMRNAQQKSSSLSFVTLIRIYGLTILSDNREQTLRKKEKIKKAIWIFIVHTIFQFLWSLMASECSHKS